jgi:hypothetical protein
VRSRARRRRARRRGVRRRGAGVAKKGNEVQAALRRLFLGAGGRLRSRRLVGAAHGGAALVGGAERGGAG